MARSTGASAANGAIIFNPDKHFLTVLTEIKIENKKYLILSEKDILAVVQS